MKFIILFDCTLIFIHGLITKKMINEVNEIIFKGDDLELSILNLFYGYIYADSILISLRESYYGICPRFQDKIKRIYSKDKPTDILSTALINLIPSPDGIINTSNISGSSLAQKYFINKKSKSNSIIVFSTLFIKLLKKDKLFKLNNIIVDEQNSITDPKLLEILDKDIEEDRDILSYILLILHAFMLEVLDTKDELKEYVTNIINLLSEEDKKIIKTSLYYYLKFKKVESEPDEKTIFNTLYNITDYKFPYNFYKRPANDIQIPVYNRLNDEYDEVLEFEDSVDISLLHLCNLLFFNEEKEQFDLEHLKLDEDSNLLKFYTKYKKPIYISRFVRNEWSKVIQCLNDIVISGKKYNKNLGKIFYLKEFTRNKLDSSICNIVTILTKICSSRHNDIRKIYIELFDREFEANNVSDLLQKFFSLLANKSIDVNCQGEKIQIKDNIIYGLLTITTLSKNKERLKTQLMFTLYYKFTYVTLTNKDYLFSDKIETIKYKIKDEEELNPLEYIVVNYANELKNKVLDKHYYYDSNNFVLFNNKLLISNVKKSNYLHYLFYKLDGTDLDYKIFNTIEMIVKSALENKSDQIRDLPYFYVMIDDLRSGLSPKEILDIWVDLLYKFDLYESKNIFKLWNEEMKKVEILDECNFSDFIYMEKYKYALEILKDKKIKKLILCNNECIEFDFKILFSHLESYNFLTELDFGYCNFKIIDFKYLCEFILEKNISSLELNDCNLGFRLVEILAESLLNKENDLTKLNIKNNYIGSYGAMCIGNI